MNLELTDSEHTELKKLLKNFFINYHKVRDDITGKLYYRSMIMENYSLEEMISLRTLLDKVLTPEELIKLEEDYRLHNWGQWFPD